jgi:hypothetical protein
MWSNRKRCEFVRTFFAVRASIDESNSHLSLGALDDSFLLTDRIGAWNTINSVGIKLSLIESSSEDLLVVLVQGFLSFSSTGGVLRADLGFVVVDRLSLEFTFERRGLLVSGGLLIGTIGANGTATETRAHVSRR